MVPYLRCANVLDGRIDYSDVNEMHFSEADQRKYTLRRDDILLNEGQSTELVGRSAIYDGPEGRYCYQNSLVNFRCGPSLTAGFARAVFKRWLDIGHFTTILKQTTSMAHLGGERFARLELPVPPLPEQRQIAAILDTVDEAIRKTEQIIAKLKQVRQGLLHDLLTRGIDDNGELRDPEHHPEHFKDSPLGRIPRDWAVVELGKIAEVFNGTTPSRARSDYWSGTVPWLSSGCVNDYCVTSPTEHVTELAVSDRSMRIVPAGAVVVGMIGEGRTRGMSARLEISASINQNLAAVVPIAEANGTYIHLYLTHHYGRLRGGGRGSNQDALNCSLVRKFPVFAPLGPEQGRIASFMADFEQRQDAENVACGKLVLLKAGLMEDLLTGRVRVTSLLESVTP